MVLGGVWLAQLVEHPTLDPRVVSSSPTLGVKKRKRKETWSYLISLIYIFAFFKKSFQGRNVFFLYIIYYTL